MDNNNDDDDDDDDDDGHQQQQKKQSSPNVPVDDTLKINHNDTHIDHKNVNNTSVHHDNDNGGGGVREHGFNRKEQQPNQNGSGMQSENVKRTERELLAQIEHDLQKGHMETCVQLIERFMAQYGAKELIWNERYLVKRIMRQVESSQGVDALRDFVSLMEKLQDDLLGTKRVEALLPGWMYTQVLHSMVQSDVHAKEVTHLVKHVMERVVAAAKEANIGDDPATLPPHFKRNYLVTRTAFVKTISGLCRHLMNHEALEMYEMMKISGIRLHQPEVIELVMALAKLEQQLDIINVIYDIMIVNSDAAAKGQKEPISIDDTCCAIVTGYARSFKNGPNSHAMVKDFLSILLQVAPEIISARPFEAYINGICRAGKMNLVEEAFAWLSEIGIEPSEYMYGSTIIGFAEAQDFDKAEHYLKETRSKKMAISPSVYHILLRGYVRGGKTIEAEELMDFLFDNNMTGPETTDMFIDGLVKASRHQEAFQAFASAKEKSKPFSIKSIHALLEASMAEEERDLLDAAIKEMRESSVQPNNMTASILTRALVKFDEADKVVSQIFMSPSSLTEQICEVKLFNSLIMRLVQKNDISTAYKVLDFLESDALPLVWPTNATYTHFATELLKTRRKNRANEALALLKRMEQNGLKHNVHSYNARIHAFFQKRQYNFVAKIFDDMDHWTVQPNVWTIRFWISHIASQEFRNGGVDDFARALKLRVIPRMERWGIILSNSILEQIARRLVQIAKSNSPKDQEPAETLSQVARVLENLIKDHDEKRIHSVVARVAESHFPRKSVKEWIKLYTPMESSLV